MGKLEADRSDDDELETVVEDEAGPDVEGHILRMGPDRAADPARDPSRLISDRLI
ncbi:MAG TPA: hypothetical protein VID68_00285 [Solirubrobacteraceae bacterium]